MVAECQRQYQSVESLFGDTGTSTARHITPLLLATSTFLKPKHYCTYLHIFGVYVTQIFFFYNLLIECVCLCVYHPEHHVDDKDGWHPSERQPLQDAAARVRVVASLRCAVPLLPHGVQEAKQIRLPPLHRGRCHHKLVRMRH